MDNPARNIALVPPTDGRQSETALAIARGTARVLRSLGVTCISGLPLPSGRRADRVALKGPGRVGPRSAPGNGEAVVAGGASHVAQRAGRGASKDVRPRCSGGRRPSRAAEEAATSG